jgi:hypothetical protein
MENRPLSGIMQRSRSPFRSRPEWNSSSRMMKIDAEPVFPFVARLENHRPGGMEKPISSILRRSGSRKKSEE